MYVMALILKIRPIQSVAGIFSRFCFAKAVLHAMRNRGEIQDGNPDERNPSCDFPYGIPLI